MLMRLGAYKPLSVPFVLRSHRPLFDHTAAGELTGNKQERVRDYVLRQATPKFRRRDVERALPGASPATIRLALGELRSVGKIKPEGSGRGAYRHRP